jgi:hypothetical protein
MFIRPFRLDEFSYGQCVYEVLFSNGRNFIRGQGNRQSLKKKSTEDILKAIGRFFTLKPSDHADAGMLLGVMKCLRPIVVIAKRGCSASPFTEDRPSVPGVGISVIVLEEWQII